MKRSLPPAGAVATPAKRLASATDLNSLIVAVGSTLAAALGQQGIHSLEALVSIEPEQLGPLAMGAGVTEAAIGEAQGKASAALPVSASARQTPAAAIRLICGSTGRTCRSRVPTLRARRARSPSIDYEQSLKGADSA